MLVNRERILASVRTLFAAEGAQVTMREVARHAGVGPATLYRHFATKETLATAAFVEEMRSCHAILEEGIADPDPWSGFCFVIQQICELHADNRAFTAAFVAALPQAIDVAAERRRSLAQLAELTGRAERAGELRPGFVLDDLVLMLTAHRAVRASSPAERRDIARRFAALTIRAFEPDA